MNKFLFIIIAMSLSSYARIFNEDVTKFRLHAPPGTTVTYANTKGDDEIRTASSKRGLKIETSRSRSPMVIKIRNETIDTAISIRPVCSQNWYANLAGCGVGFLFDIGTVKKYGYPYRVYINSDARRGYSTVKPFIVPRSQLTILPLFMMPVKIRYGNAATSGIGTAMGVGFNYYTTPRTFYSVDAALVADPITVGDRFYLDSMAPQPSIGKGGWYINLRRHEVMGKFDLGYGLSAGKRTFVRYYIGYPGATYKYDSVTSSSKAFSMGCALAITYRITRSFYGGVNYQPQFAEIGDKMSWKYGHIISAGFFWRIKLRPYYRQG